MLTSKFVCKALSNFSAWLLSKATVLHHRRVVGRPRRHTPVWHVPVVLNQQYLTTLTATVRKGQNGHLEQKLTEIREAQRHLLPGMVARYITRDCERPERVCIVLIWRERAMPSEQEQQATIAALCDDLSEFPPVHSAREIGLRHTINHTMN